MARDNRSNYTPDLSVARLFLSLLDPAKDRIWHLRAIHPHLDSKDPAKAKKLVGTLDSRLLEQAAALNLEGYGIFAVVNEGGNTAASIRRCIGLVADCDVVGDGHEARAASAAVPVSLAMESSPGKHHYYWLTTDELPGDAIPVGEFTAAQKALIRIMGSDPTIHDLPRVMRVPGFYHTKGDVWFMSRMLTPANDVYTVSWEADLKPWLEREGAPQRGVMGASGVVEGEDWEAAFARGVGVHEHGKKLLAKWHNQGLDREAIAARFAPLLDRVAVARGIERAEAFAFDELPRLYTWVLEKDAERIAQKAATRAANAALGEEEVDLLSTPLTLEEMLERFVYVARGPQVFDREHPGHVLSLEEFGGLVASSVTFVVGGDGKKRKVKVAAQWKDDPRRVTVHDVTFRAGLGVIVRDEGRALANMWAGWEVEGIEGDAEPFLAHVRMLYGDRSERFLDWLAHIVQRPGELPHTCWLHISSYHGTGRNWLASVLLRVLRGHCVTNVDLAGMLDGGFNGVIAGRCLAVVDEIREGGADRWRHAERFKQMLTAETVLINPKFAQQREEFNSCRWMLNSNHRSAIPIERGDRRVECVVHDEPPREEAYFVMLYGLLKDGRFIEAVMWTLATRDISGFNAGARAEDSLTKQMLVDATQDSGVLSLSDAFETWKWPLATFADLAEMAGVTVTAGTQRQFAHTVEEAGWVAIGRVKLSGVRVMAHCRKGDFSRWKEADNAKIRAGLGWDERKNGPKAVK